MKPYKFEPFLKTTIWGGYRIAPFKGIYTAQPNIGESWEISGVPGHESVAVERGLVDDVDVGLNLTHAGRHCHPRGPRRRPLLPAGRPPARHWCRQLPRRDSGDQRHGQALCRGTEPGWCTDRCCCRTEWSYVLGHRTGHHLHGLLQEISGQGNRHGRHFASK